MKKLTKAEKILVYAIYIAFVLAMVSAFIIAFIREYKYDTLQELRPCPFCGSTNVEYMDYNKEIAFE